MLVNEQGDNGAKPVRARTNLMRMVATMPWPRHCNDAAMSLPCDSRAETIVFACVFDDDVVSV